MELEIKGKTYPLKVTFGALNKLNELTKKSGNTNESIGLVQKYVELKEAGDPEALRDLILCLNSTLTPQLQKSVLEEYLSELDEPEILSKAVLDYLMTAGLSRMRLQAVLPSINAQLHPKK